MSRHGKITARARVETERPSRYLVQLCEHVTHLSHSRPEFQAHADWSEESGLIDFGWGRCALQVEPRALLLHAEAQDEQRLMHLERQVAHRLEQIGRRDGLRVTWQRTGDRGVGDHHD